MANPYDYTRQGSDKIRFRRGDEQDLPLLDLAEPAITTDTKRVLVGTGTENLELVGMGPFKQLTDYVNALDIDAENRAISLRKFEHLKVAVGSGWDWQPVIQGALNYIARGGVVTLPPGTLDIYSPITIKNNQQLVGQFLATRINIKGNFDGILLRGNMAVVSGLQVNVGVAGYTQSAIKVINLPGSHQWKPKIHDVFLNGYDMENPEGNGISLVPKRDDSDMKPGDSPVVSGIMNLTVTDTQIRGFDHGIYVPPLDPLVGWADCHHIRNCWVDYCKHGLYGDGTALYQSVIEAFNAQFSPPTLSHITITTGGHFVIRDCLMYDGGRIHLEDHTHQITVSGLYTVPDKVVDSGFGNMLVSNPSESMATGHFFYDTENFIGAQITDKWHQSVTGTATIGTVMDLGFVAENAGAKLSTGATANSSARLSYNLVNPYGQYTHQRFTAKVRFDSPDGIHATIGLCHTTAEGFTWGKYMFELIDGYIIPTVQVGDEKRTAPPIRMNNIPHNYQIMIPDSLGKDAIFHIDGKFVARIPIIEELNLQPLFEIVNTEEVDNYMVVSKYEVRNTEFYMGDVEPLV